MGVFEGWHVAEFSNIARVHIFVIEDGPKVVVNAFFDLDGPDGTEKHVKVPLTMSPDILAAVKYLVSHAQQAAKSGACISTPDILLPDDDVNSGE